MDIPGISTFDRTALKDQIAEDRLAIRAGLEAAVVTAGQADRDKLRWILKADRAELWRADGHRSCTQFVSATCHVSNWKARRWIEAAHVLEHLPHTAAALGSGALSLDKVVELARFVTPADESRWVRWAAKTTTGGVRDRADKEVKRDQAAAAKVDATRYLTHSLWDDHIWIEARLPVDEGMRVVAAIDELAADLPGHPDDTAERSIDQRRADALVALVTSSGSGSSDTTVVVHAPLEALTIDQGSASLAGGPALHPETARRLCCDSKLQTVLEGEANTVVGIGRASRVVPKWLRDLVLERDGHVCAFPGCEQRRHLYIHHIVHWSRGGRTDSDNLTCLCHLHHKLVHEYRWSVTLDDRHRSVWFRPGGRVYQPGPAPPTDVPEPKKEPPRLAEAVGFSRLLGLAAVL